MITDELLEKARLHVRRWFARRMPRHMHFHDLEHTLGVARTAVGIAQAMKLPAADVALLELAALFHDTGYALSYTDHEEHGAQLAEAFMHKQGVPATTRARVKALIRATRMGAKPRSILQQVMRDADSAKAGQVDFGDHSERLRRELGAVRGKRPASADWQRENLAYLDGHRFYTPYAEERYGRQKAINRAALVQVVATPAAGKRKPPTVAERFFERDLSWMAFNERVLQEAKDPRVPLLERIKFLAIYSSNLDEFYRVRVASLRSLGKLKKSTRAALEVPAARLIERINRKALRQQQEFGRLYRNELLPQLAGQGIRILREDQLDKAATAHVRRYFTEHIAPLLITAEVRPGNAPFIEDRRLYFVVGLRSKGRRKQRLMLLNIPSDQLPRILRLPSSKGRTDLLFLDDAIRLCLGEFFTGHRVLGCHAIKLSRDAELYLDEEFQGNVKEKVRKSLRKRLTGVPARFLYDQAMPQATLKALRTLLGLAKPDLVAGGRYHNFSDLIKLPVEGHEDLRDTPWPALQHPAVAGGRDLFATLRQRDLLWHFPYHDFGMMVNWLQQAAADDHVQHLAITLYRVADGSAVCNALMEALRRGKRVTVFVEVQARFDERSNLYWGETLEKAGARVLYSYERLKVHCKLLLVERREGDGMRRYAYLGTGNFNERTSRIYSDSALLTARPEMTDEVAEVFRHLADRRVRPSLDHLLMAPTTLRPGVEALIDREIEHALQGRRAEVLLKLNSLEDQALIRKLYDASSAGVRVRLIVRGICCLVPGVPGLSTHIEAISIVDRYLEHTRAYVFHNGGKPLVMLSSADWMGRNLDRRVEVAFPLLDRALRREMLALLELQWTDNTKARQIDLRQTNPYRTPKPGEKAVHAQGATYARLRRATLKAPRP